MAKIKRSRCSTTEEHREVAVDRISSLPNEVLGFILSFLPLKEAIAATLVSKKWKNLWLLTHRLNIDGTDSLRKVKNSGHDESALEIERFENPMYWLPVSELDRQRYKYLRFVDHALTLHHNSSDLEEFRVVFDLNRLQGEWIDGWVRYAVSRKVQILDLNLTDVRGARTIYSYPLCYSFPYKDGDSLPENFGLLRQLCLHSVKVLGGDLEYFLRNCPLLEKLSVSESNTLLYVEIVRPSPLFKCLEISFCDGLKSVVVRDSKLLAIKYCGPRIHYFELTNVPLLAELWIRTERFKDVVAMFSTLLPKLRMLKIYFRQLYAKEFREFGRDVDMPNLRKLVVNIEKSYCDSQSLIPVVNLISASPRLERFVVEAAHQHSKDDKYLDYDAFGPREIEKKIPRAYFHLKEVEFIGYRGVINQFEMIMNLVDNVVALENITVDPRCFKLRPHRPWDFIATHNIEDELFARTHAEHQVKPQVPSKVNMKIL